jgi:hypothetical protein
LFVGLKSGILSYPRDCDDGPIRKVLSELDGTETHKAILLVVIGIRIFCPIFGFSIDYITFHSLNPDLDNMTVGFGTCHINTKTHAE